jgi:hypothetical protein
MHAIARVRIPRFPQRTAVKSRRLQQGIWMDPLFNRRAREPALPCARGCFCTPERNAFG